MLDVLLVKLNYSEVLESDREFDLATAYLAAALRREGFATTIMDASLESLSTKELCQRILQTPARVIGISVWLHRLVEDAERLVKALRSHGITSHITMGSHSPSFLYHELLTHNPGLDSVVCGEGEHTMVELVRRVVANEPYRHVKGLATLADQQLVFEPRPATCSLDEIPLPDLDYIEVIKERRQIMSLLSSRGCYGRCTFCSTGPFYRLAGGIAWRAHSPARVIQELKRLYYEHGLKHFGFRDDNFMGPGEAGRLRARAIAQGILDEGMDIRFYIACRVNDVDPETFSALKVAGLVRVFLGVESGSQRRLDAFRKGATVEQNLSAIRVLSELKIPATLGYIMFSPDTSWQEYKESLQFLQKSLGSIDALSDAIHDPFNTVEIFPGTQMAEDLRREDALLGDYRGYSYKFKDYRIRALVKAVGFLRRRAKKLGRRLNAARYQKRTEVFMGEERRECE